MTNAGSKEANKTVAKDSDASLGTRATAAKDALGDKVNEVKDGASAEAHKVGHFYPNESMFRSSGANSLSSLTLPYSKRPRAKAPSSIMATSDASLLLLATTGLLCNIL
ncbi:hypothetical protein Pst134EA_017181 [Puccinia striiformis f. sp. tritici]|nr:hypothetical protein Pst134EA_017181 [Puccinia striiformis f. sp. tritici]KAH9460870.1 hypothetical protein Pst134EA_017181 [Puccinia striiformis f. sp. tritici]